MAPVKVTPQRLTHARASLPAALKRRRSYRAEYLNAVSQLSIAGAERVESPEYRRWSAEYQLLDYVWSPDSPEYRHWSNQEL